MLATLAPVAALRTNWPTAAPTPSPGWTKVPRTGRRRARACYADCRRLVWTRQGPEILRRRSTVRKRGFTGASAPQQKHPLRQRFSLAPSHRVPDMCRRRTSCKVPVALVREGCCRRSRPARRALQRCPGAPVARMEVKRAANGGLRRQPAPLRDSSSEEIAPSARMTSALSLGLSKGKTARVDRQRHPGRHLPAPERAQLTAGWRER